MHSLVQIAVVLASAIGFAVAQGVLGDDELLNVHRSITET
jgi:hypothetical protein